MFAEAGMDSLGVDLSAVGIDAARREQAASGARFEVGDVLNLPYARSFDLVFCRSLSLYNGADFASAIEPSRRLLGYVAPSGQFVFCYHSKLARRKQAKSPAWRYHDLQDLQRHFARFDGARCLFSTRIDCLLLGRHGLSDAASGASAALSRGLGIGGELLAFVPATASTLKAS